MATVLQTRANYASIAERLKARLLEHQEKIRISRVRLQVLKEVYQETEGQPQAIQRARFLEKWFEKLPIWIDENPIVGSNTEHIIGVQPLPEWSCNWMKKAERIRTFRVYYGSAMVDDADVKLLEEAATYWQDKCIWNRTKELFYQKHPDVRIDDIGKAGIWLPSAPQPYGTSSPDYGKVLQIGLDGVIREIEEELNRLPLGGGPENLDKRYTLNAMTIACKAVIRYARRYAALAREMAQAERDAGRKHELEKIASTCEWIPANPARSFYEALQSVWFVHLGCTGEANALGTAWGRFTQYLYPFYERDMVEQKISREDATGLIQLLFIRIAELQHLLDQRYQQTISGHTGNQLSIGGLTRDGEDATNELDFHVLEAQRRNRLPQPALSVLYHNKLSNEFLLKVVEVIRTGIGMPAIQNSEVTVQRLMSHSAVTLEDAREWCTAGCVETISDHRQDEVWKGMLNMPKMLELALNDSKDPLTGLLVGVQTSKELESYDKLEAAIRKQLRYFITLFNELDEIGENLQGMYVPKPFISALVDDCIKRGKDIYCGGARYHSDGIGWVGMVNLANSLAAVKKLIYEEKKTSLEEIKKALAADFQGYEELHHMLLSAPKYGNDDLYVDSIMRKWTEIFWEEHPTKDYLGTNTSKPYAFSPSAHFAFGLYTGALPSGRKAKVPLSDASVSPEPGTDRNGPTALIKSAASAIDCVKYAHNHFNMKFLPQALESQESQRKFISMIKTYMDMGGHHIQFNVVDGKTLRDAQLHPENYRSLVVRVAGFSAFFVTLEKYIQDEIIKRTEYKTI